MITIPFSERKGVSLSIVVISLLPGLLPTSMCAEHTPNTFYFVGVIKSLQIYNKCQDGDVSEDLTLCLTTLLIRVILV